MKKPNVLMAMSMIAIFGFNNLLVDWNDDHSKATISNNSDDCYCTLDEEDWNGVQALLDIDQEIAEEEQEQLAQLAPGLVDDNVETL